MKSFSLYAAGRKITDKTFIEKIVDENHLGIFESLRTYGSHVFRAEEHLRRFLESARTAGCQETLDLDRLSRELDQALHAYWQEHAKGDDLFIRMSYWPSASGEPEGLFVMIGTRKHPQDLYEKGIVLKASPVRRSLFNAAPAEAKTSAYQNAVLATLEPSESVYEWLLLDRNGYVTEVRIGNIFIVKDSELLTPLRIGILNGVTRKFVIECALQAGIRVKETVLTRHEIYNADEAFLTNTSWEILPIRELDSRSVGQKIPGPVTSKLQKLFKERVKNEIHSQSPRQRFR